MSILNEQKNNGDKPLSIKEFEEKTKNWTKDDEATAANEFMQLFVEFGQMKETNPADEQVQLQVRKLQDYITNHFYTCSDKILCGLGRMYAGGGELTENIDNVGGSRHCGVCKQSHGYILYEQEIRKILPETMKKKA